MADAKSREVGQWLQKASHDLSAARHLLERVPPLSDIAVYHCQQTAEKASKAFLMEKDTFFGKMHDLDALVASRASMDPAFAVLSEPAAILTPYAVLFRYPTGQPDPPVDEAWQAAELARQVLDLVLDRLSGIIR